MSINQMSWIKEAIENQEWIKQWVEIAVQKKKERETLLVSRLRKLGLATQSEVKALQRRVEELERLLSARPTNSPTGRPTRSKKETAVGKSNTAAL